MHQRDLNLTPSLSRIVPDEKTVEEERRIFYVAMTRAVSELYILYTDGKENSKYMPSRFLAPVINKKGKPL